MAIVTIPLFFFLDVLESYNRFDVNSLIYGFLSISS